MAMRMAFETNVYGGSLVGSKEDGCSAASRRASRATVSDQGSLAFACSVHYVSMC